MNEWIQKNLNYRIPEKLFSNERLDKNEYLVKKICAFDKKNIFQINRENLVGNRASHSFELFKNLIEHEIVQFNWCDAQSWDYSKVEIPYPNLPVFQFSRQKHQKDNVILFPLDRDFMGYGGKNIPSKKDNLNYLDKLDDIVWRGRISGTSSDNLSYIHWSEGLLNDNNPTEKLVKTLMNTIRMDCVSKLSKYKKIIDVGFSCTNKEKKIICKNSIKYDYLNHTIKSKIGIDGQRHYKFILAIPGNDYASSIYWSLLSNSVVMLVDNPWETALDQGLTPWVHYVPVSGDAEDLLSKRDYLLSNPNKAIDIINNAHQYMEPYLDKKLRNTLDYLTIMRYRSQYISDLPENKHYFN